MGRMGKAVSRSAKGYKFQISESRRAPEADDQIDLYGLIQTGGEDADVWKDAM